MGHCTAGLLQPPTEVLGKVAGPAKATIGFANKRDPKARAIQTITLLINEGCIQRGKHPRTAFFRAIAGKFV
jgi:hypothetical protein